jgi:hypothetical protein
MYEGHVIAEPTADDVARVAGLLGGRADGAWHTERLGAWVAGATAGLWRVRGDGWSAIAKTLAHSDRGHAHWRTSGDERDPMYWRREALAYCTGFLDRVLDEERTGLRAPRCLACSEHDDGSVTTWLEDVRGLPGAQWPLLGYAAVSRALGRMQGRHAAESSVPDESWLSRGWLRAYVARRESHGTVLLDDARWREVPPPARDAGALRDVFVRAWRDRDALLDGLDRVPRTLCHLDLHPDNLFGVTRRDGLGRVVMVDWAYTGIGTLGEDVGNLIFDAQLDLHVAPEEGRALAELCVGAYVFGLHEGGWDGDDRVVRFAVAASAIVKYTWMLPHVLLLATGEEGGGASVRGVDVDEVIARRLVVCGQLRDVAEEAWTIGREVGLL